MNRFEITNRLDSNDLMAQGVDAMRVGTLTECGVYVVLPRFERFAPCEDKARSGSRMGQGIWGTRHYWVRSSSWIFVAPLGFDSLNFWKHETIVDSSLLVSLEYIKELISLLFLSDVFFWTSCPSDLIWRDRGKQKSDTGSMPRCFKRYWVLRISLLLGTPCAIIPGLSHAASLGVLNSADLHPHPAARPVWVHGSTFFAIDWYDFVWICHICHIPLYNAAAQCTGASRWSSV